MNQRMYALKLLKHIQSNELEGERCFFRLIMSVGQRKNSESPCMSLYIVDVPLLSLILYIDVAIYLYIHSFVYLFFFIYVIGTPSRLS